MHDIAFGRLQSPDLDQAEEFLTDFGMARAGGNEQASITLAKELGLAARKRVAILLAEPFTVHTAWADGRGNPRFKRYYGFITDAKGRDLEELIPDYAQAA